MSFLGGGSDDSASREMIEMQKQEAAKAELKEQERQARIKEGLAKIKGAFHGTPETVKKTFDWKTFNPATQKAGAVPGMSGYSFVDLPAITAVAGRPAVPGARSIVPTSEGGWREGPVTGGSPAVTAVPGRAGGVYIKGPDGKLYKQGDVVSSNVATGKTTGGLGDPFFNDFKQGILDFYTPQVADKYEDAQKETTYRLADAGTLRSSTANDLTADLYKQNLTNLADVRSKADTAAADLKTRAKTEEDRAVSQLYAEEDPTRAAANALHSVTNLIGEKPTSTPLGDIFNIAAIGGAKFLQGRDDAAFSKKVGALTKPTAYTRTVG
jgi:hypothetical protein